MNKGVVPGQVYSLAVHFGNQVRTKCAVCKHFMRNGGAKQVTCGCGQKWKMLSQGEFEAML